LNSVLEHADVGGVFAAYGLTDLVEVWTSDTLQRMRLIATGHGSITQLTFVAGSRDFVTTGNDGRLIRWTITGDKTVLAQVGQPIDRFVSLPEGDVTVFSTTDGALWRTIGDLRTSAVRPAGSRTTRLLAVPAQRAIYVGYADGEVVAIDTTSWQSHTILRSGGAIQAVEITPDGQTLAVASNDGIIHLAPARIAGAVGWLELRARASYLDFTADGLLIATSIDGTIWIYAVAQQHWLCLPLGSTDLRKTALSADGRSAVAVDRGGRLINIDLDAARSLLTRSP
jgi:WD40 repeat protein